MSINHGFDSRPRIVLDDLSKKILKICGVVYVLVLIYYTLTWWLPVDPWVVAAWLPIAWYSGFYCKTERVLRKEREQAETDALVARIMAHQEKGEALQEHREV